MKNCAALTLLIVAVVLLPLSASRAGRLVDRNLIVNGDAESDVGQSSMASDIDVSGWDDDVVTAILYGAANFPTAGSPGPVDRGANLFGAGVAASSLMSQEIDLAALSVGIDAGLVRFELSGWFGGLPSQADEIELGLQFLDAAGADVGVEQTIGRTVFNATGLFFESTSGSVAMGARRARLELRGTRDEGTFIDSYADDLSLTLSAPACADSLDNDGDDLVDLDDPDCSNLDSEAEIRLAADISNLSSLDASRTVVDSVRGWEFSVTEDVGVTHLGWFDECDSGTSCGGADGLSASHSVGIYAADETLLASVVIGAPAGPRVLAEFANGGFPVEAIEPIVLRAGQSYVIAGTDPANPFDFAWSDSPQVVYDDRIVFEAYRQQLGSAVLAFPSEVVAASSGYFGPNFALPAPTAGASGSAALASVMLLRAWARRRARRGRR